MQAGRIGPNAVTRLAEALTSASGAARCREVFGGAGLSELLADPPITMIDEAIVSRLHQSLVARLGAAEAEKIAWDAGIRTGDYLLAHRIPRPFQWLLSRLPRRLAAAILVRAIARHAWTFVGSGHFSFTWEPDLVLRLEGSPVCRLLHSDVPSCAYFAATFQRILAAMLGPAVSVTETACAATGAEACLFRITWTPDA